MAYKTISELLKDAPKGTKLYSPIFGYCELYEVAESGNICIAKESSRYWFSPEGVQITGYPDGECLLFPSKEIHDWANYKPHYEFKPFDRVIVMTDDKIWRVTFFSNYNEKDKHPYECIDDSYSECYPYTSELDSYIGTNSDRVREYYGK